MLFRSYQTVVHRDENGKMLVVKNPTAYALPGKSSYEVKAKETDGSIDLKTQAQIEDFLNTFFKLYPQTSAKELVYYVKDGVLPAIGKNYVYDGLAGHHPLHNRQAPSPMPADTA